MICIDLEDAVPPGHKAEARRYALDFLEQAETACEIVVRINSLRSRDGLEDLLALASVHTPPALLALPKAESVVEIEITRSVLSRAGTAPEIIALIETLRGLERAGDIARAPGVAIVGLGSADLSAEMGVSMEWEPMLLARLQLVQATKAARVQALDGAWVHLDDAEGLVAETRRATALGYSAKVCLHPRQVEAIHAALKPQDSEIELARTIVAAFEGSGGAAVQLDGRMIDLPMAEAARRMLADWNHRD